MSFTDDVISELMHLESQKTCCRKAMLFGMLFGGEKIGDREVRTLFRRRDIGEYAAYVLKKQFSAEPRLEEISRAGRRLTSVSASTKAIAAFLEGMDRSDGKSLGELVGFRCPDCTQAFLRGVFISTATISDPKKSYHLEFSVAVQRRADLLAELLETEIGRAGRIARNGKYGVYYKRNALIGDLLYYLGAMKVGFEFSDDYIAHNIRNIVNRSTNCESGNLARTVDAAVKQIEAINTLAEQGILETLGEDVCYTARMRIENPETSMAELAAAHVPPISKSMLNRRLTKIIKRYEDLK